MKKKIGLILTTYFVTLLMAGIVHANELTDGLEQRESYQARTVNMQTAASTSVMLENVSVYKDYGNISNNVKAKLYSNGALVISGTGDMKDWSSSNVPWYNEKSKILIAKIEDGVTNIGKYTFRYCENLTRIEIGKGVTNISGYAIYDCGNLQTVKFDEASPLLSIGSNVFYYCNQLNSINLPSELTIIKSNAFYGCSGLESINIPSKVTKIEQRAFEGCTSLKNIYVDENNSNYSNNGDGVLFNKEKTKIVCYPAGKTAETYNILSSVTSIEPYAFYQCQKLQSVTFEEETQLTSIGNYAFYNCNSLKEIEISKKVKNIGTSAFYNCDALESIKIPASVTKIESSAFYDCGKLNSVEFGTPEDKSLLTSIGSSAFYNCDALESIIIPEGVTSIGSSAFYSCEILINVTFKEESELTKIESSAFNNCNALESITLPKKLSSIGDNAFGNCSALQNIYVNAESKYYSNNEDGILFNKDKTKIVCYPAGKSETEYNILGTVTSIGPYAFYNCDALESITIPASVTNIEYYAFYDCDGIATITIPASVKTIGSNAFYNCDNLKSVTFEKDSKLESIGYNAFYNCDELGSITIPASVKEIGDNAFYNCDNLKSVTFEKDSKLESIGYNAFYNCDELGSITIPTSVKEIGYNAFYSCGKLESITFEKESKLETIGSSAFYGCDKLESIKIPANVKKINYNTFYNCTNLKSVTFEEGSVLERIEYQAFYNCNNLGIETETGKGITIPASVTNIGYYTFYNCTNLKSVTFEEGSVLTSIDHDAFRNCDALESITIPASVTNIGYNAFYDCGNLKSVTFEEGSALTSIGYGAFSYCNNLGIETGITIPKGVTSIGYNAFYGGTNLKSVTFEEGSVLTSIEHDAFRNCDALESIEIPASVTNIAYNAFYDCEKLNSVKFGTEGNQSLLTNIGSNAFDNCNTLGSITIPEGVTSIGEKAFYGCDGLESVTIPVSVTSIGTSAFKDCVKLNNVEFKTEGEEKLPATIGTSAFENCDDLVSITIPERVTSIGEKAFYVCDGLESVTIPASVTSIGTSAFKDCVNLNNVEFKTEGEEKLPATIGASAFENCDALASITIPASVTQIGASAFKDCVNLNNVEFGTEGCEIQLTTIGASAFENCVALGNITIPEGVTRVGEKAFYGCDGLESVTISANIIQIGTSAFENCDDLVSITILSTEIQIGDSVFKDCKKLKNVKFETEEEERPLTTIGTSAFENCDALENITIIEGVISIGEKAFYGCDALKSVTIPATQSQIGDSAFKDCVILENVVFTKKEGGSSLTIIGDEAFSGCKRLGSIEIPEGVTSIGAEAFYSCESLESITIPASATQIGDSAFKDCVILGNVVFTQKEGKSSLTIIGNEAFSECNRVTSIEIPEGVTRIGEKAFNSCDSLASITIPVSVTQIGDSAFNSCNSLESITIEEGSKLTSISNSMFENCNSLGNIEIPEKVKNIGSSAFKNCSSLTKIVIPKEVTGINSNAFENCGSLVSIAIREGVTSIGSDTFKNCNNLTIYCKSNTYAETYAIDNNRKYEIDDEGPEIIIDRIWTKEDTTIKISAEDDKSGLAKKTYSFDEGVTWQKESEQNIQLYTEDTNGIKIMAVDNLGNISEVITDVKIDREAPTISSVEGNPENWTRENVTLTINANDSLSGIKEYSFDGGMNWQEENTKTYSENTENIVIMVRDNAGNETSYEEVINIDKIDKEAPVIESIEGNPENWTKENVTLTINANDSLSGIKEYSFDGGMSWQEGNTKTYSESTENIVIMVKDNAGNETVLEEVINIDKIDKENPTIESVEGNAIDWTSQSVTLTINANDSLSGIKEYSFDGGMNWQEENTKTYSENTENIVIMVRDNVGNETAYEEVINIDKIDKEAPVIESIEGNPENWTNENVTLTINANDSLSGIKEYSFDGGMSWQEENTKTYSENTSNIQIVVKDNAGNEIAYGEVINIDKIDKEAPVIESVEGNATDWTAESVTLTINANDSLSGIKEYSFDGGMSWQEENTKTYSENTSNIQIVVKDNAGNETALEEVINIDKIDKENPTIESVEGNAIDWTSQSVTLTINANDSLSGIKEYSFDGGMSWQAGNTKTYSENTSNIQILVKDNAGNEIAYEEVINIDKIDKKAPVIESIEGNPENWISENVTLTINANDSLSGIKEYSFDGGVSWQEGNTKTYSENTSNIQILVKDNAGNEIAYEEVINIDKIDKEAPVIESIEGNPENWTSENVTLTINANDSLSGIKEYSFDGGMSWQEGNTKTYSENTSNIQIVVKDNAGNEIAYDEVINIDKIDKENPTIESVEGNAIDWTSQSVTLTINANDSLSGIKEYSFDGGMSWQAGNTKTYSENTENIVIMVRDNVGNETGYEEVVNIDKIDKEDPVIESIEGNPENWTSENVTLTINANDSLSGIKEYSFDGGMSWQEENTKTYSENTENIVIVVRDNVGNETAYGEVINIDKIDKEASVIESIEGNPENWTRENVTLTINANDSLSGIKEYSFDGGMSWQEENTKTYSENTSNVQIVVKDNAGNETSLEETITIDKIDKYAPIIEVQGNIDNWTRENIKVTVVAEDKESGLAQEAYSFDGGKTWGASNEYTYTKHTKTQILVKDKVGNIEVYDIEAKIDVAVPKIGTVEMSATEWTEESVTLTIVDAKDTLSGLDEEPYSFDGGMSWQEENTKTYFENTEGIVICVKDKLGNAITYEKTININNIIELKEIAVKEKPEKIEYILGEETNITGLVIEKVFNNGVRQELTEEYEYSPKVFEQEGPQQIALQYKDKTATIEVKVEKVELTSEEYAVEEKIISNIQPGTTVKEIKEKITTNASTIKLYNKEGHELKDKDLVTTKTKIKLNNIEEYSLVVRGDTNGDGKSDIKDILQINKHRLNKAKLEGEYLKAADVDENNIADIKDILKINKYRLKKINLL